MADTKAISKYNAAVTMQSGRVGNVRYYQKNGNTYVRSTTVSSKKNKRSDAQMRQRILFAGLNHFYCLFGTKLKSAFSLKASNISDYNAFMQANQGVGVYYSKDMNQHQACVVMPAQISNGGLDTIAMSTVTKGSNAVTNIPCKASDLSTVKKLADALVSASNYQYGDVLTIFTFVPGTVAGIDHVQIRTKRIALSKTDESALTGFAADGGYLKISIQSDEQAVGVIHMSQSGNCSTSYIGLCDEALAAYEALRTDEQFYLVRDTYGEAESNFLKEGDDEEESTDPTFEKFAGFSMSYKDPDTAVGKAAASTPDATTLFLSVSGTNLSGITASDVTLSSGTAASVKTVTAESDTLLHIEMNSCDDAGNGTIYIKGEEITHWGQI